MKTLLKLSSPLQTLCIISPESTSCSPPLRLLILLTMRAQNPEWVCFPHTFSYSAIYTSSSSSSYIMYPRPLFTPNKGTFFAFYETFKLFFKCITCSQLPYHTHHSHYCLTKLPKIKPCPHLLLLNVQRFP